MKRAAVVVVIFLRRSKKKKRKKMKLDRIVDRFDRFLFTVRRDLIYSNLPYRLSPISYFHSCPEEGIKLDAVPSSKQLY